MYRALQRINKNFVIMKKMFVCNQSSNIFINKKTINISIKIERKFQSFWCKIWYGERQILFFTDIGV